MTDKTDRDAFDKESYETVSLITMLRIYDLLLVIARGINEDEAVQAARLHAEGKVLGPPPSWNMSDEQSD